MKKIIAILFFASINLHISAQVDVTTNVADVVHRGASIFIEQTVGNKNIGLGVGLVYRPFNSFVSNSSFEEGYETFSNDRFVSLIQYKWYFSKNRKQKIGWYINTSNRIESIVKWNKDFLVEYEKVNAETFNKYYFRTIQIGSSIGYKSIYKEKFIFLYSIGMYFDILGRDVLSSQAHVSIGYRFSKQIQ